jgi:hypothetical protein
MKRNNKNSMLKRTSILSFVILFITSFVFAQKKPGDLVKLDSSNINLQFLKQNNSQTARFTFTNISGTAINIENVLVTPDCSLTEFSKGAINPGKAGYVVITFNAPTIGHFEKTQNILIAGTKGTVPVTITGDVLSVADYNKQFPTENTGIKTKATPAKKEHKSKKATHD